MEDYSADYSEENFEYHDNNTNYEEDEAEYEENENTNNFCDACERGFATPAQLKFHLQEHRVCGIDGCKFVAHSKIVEKHISMQHVTGLFYRIPQSHKPEDIAKWIAERKKRYPTKENIEKRQKEQEEMKNRGERISEPKDRFGRKIKKDTDTSNKKGQRNKKNRFKNKKNKLAHLRQTPPKLKKLTKKDLPSVSLLNDKSNWNGKLPPFPGTSDLYESENEVEVEEKFDDSEWLTAEQKESPKIEISNALGALIGAYRSSDESEDELNVPVPKIVTEAVPTAQVVEVTNNEDKKEINDDEAPEEIKIIKEDSSVNQYLDKQKEENAKEDNQKSNRKRKRKHSRDENNSNKKIPVNNLSNQKTNPRKITLLERLLASEIKNERNLILQCVRYVVGNNFFEKKVSNSDKITEKVCDKENNIEMKESFVDSFDKEKNIMESINNGNVNIPVGKNKILDIKSEIDGSTDSKNDILDVKNVIVIDKDLENKANDSLDKDEISQPKSEIQTKNELENNDNSIVKNDISEIKNNFENEINESIQKGINLEPKNENSSITKNDILEIIKNNNDTNLEAQSVEKKLILETKNKIQNEIIKMKNDDNRSIAKIDISEIKNDVDNDKKLEIKINDSVENDFMSEPKCEIQPESVIVEVKNDVSNSITKNDISEIENNNDTNLENQSIKKNSILEPKNEIQTENEILEMKNDDNTSIIENNISKIRNENDNDKNLEIKSISGPKNEINNLATSEITNNVETENIEEPIKNLDFEKCESVTSEVNTENL